MSAEQDSEHFHSSAPPREQDPAVETLTDLLDRMDREAFRRCLEQSDLQVLSTTVRVAR
jgi:hypothetical protein